MVSALGPATKENGWPSESIAPAQGQGAGSSMFFLPVWYLLFLTNLIILTCMKSVVFCFLLALLAHCDSTIQYDGIWGSWKSVYSTANNYFACGAKTRLETKQGSSRDDTALNGLQMVFCKVGGNWKMQDVKTFDGLWGDWGFYRQHAGYFRNSVLFCPEYSYMYGFKVRF